MRIGSLLAVGGRIIVIAIMVCGLLFSVIAFGDNHHCGAGDARLESALVVGAASDVASGERLYCEYYFNEADNNRMIVEYRDSGNQLIVRKTLDYSTSQLSPNVLQEDFRHGELRRVALTQDDPQTLIMAYRKANSEELKTAEIPLSDATVVDAGFDAAVRRYWDQLLRDDKVKVDFVSPAHLRSFNLTIRQGNTGLCRQNGYDETSQVCLRIGPSNALVGLFVKPLVLLYEKTSRRLVLFSGAVNITSVEGATLNATIRYFYTD